MSDWLRGKSGGLVAFLLICLLVAGGLAWVTAAALDLEDGQRLAQQQAEQYDKLRVALWRLDSLLAPALAKEDSRPYNHYSAIYAPPTALQGDGNPWPPGSVLENSPLLDAELPSWMLLHFQVDQESGWRSPQVLSVRLKQALQASKTPVGLANVTLARAELLTKLQAQLSVPKLLADVKEQTTRPLLEDTTLVPGGNSALLANSMPYMPSQTANSSAQMPVDSEYRARFNRQNEMQQRAVTKSSNNDSVLAFENIVGNGEDWLAKGRGRSRASEQITVALGPMIPLWLPDRDHPALLVYARSVQVGSRNVCQGILLDWPQLRTLLADEAKKESLFPQADIVPAHDEISSHSERTMTVLPLQLDPGPPATPAPPGWTPLRVGLTLAWTAALVALLAVGMGGWSLLDLSERRIRFVSAVTHELRTPLTTLRLYLDMLAGGMVKSEEQKEEYLHTLNQEADRLNRLVGNVLDFSRLERQRPKLAPTRTQLGSILDHVHQAWDGRCQSTGKTLVVESNLPAAATLYTDVQLVEQILGNLIDNAMKYSRHAEDARIWLRARPGDSRELVLEVEDRGPGVPISERRAIFRPFRRGQTVETATGGVGLGLSLARRWAALLGGELTIQSVASSNGACFQLRLPKVLS